MASIFKHADYKAFVRAWVDERPKGGRGEYRRMASHLRISSTMISQVFNGEKELNLEMACELANFFGLNVKEERYFLLLVEYARAGSQRLKSTLKKQVEEARKASQKISERVAKHKELTNEEKAIFYSSWAYTGVRNLLGVPNDWTPAAIAERLKLTEGQVREVIQFLMDSGLIGLSDGRYEPAAKATHIGADNPLVTKHHQNWRIRGLQKMDQRSPDSLFYTGPMSLSVESAERIREILLDTVQAINRIVVDSPSETIRCFNLDWFEY